MKAVWRAREQWKGTGESSRAPAPCSSRRWPAWQRPRKHRCFFVHRAFHHSQSAYSQTSEQNISVCLD
eukprot:8086468-Pyramimonas_sp.AAC.1